MCFSLDCSILVYIVASSSSSASLALFDRTYVDSLKGVSPLAFVVWFWDVMSSLIFSLWFYPL